MKARNLLIYLGVTFLLLVGAREVPAAGTRPPTLKVAIVPIDPAPFGRFEDYDLRNFPTQLLDIVDNALFDAYKHLGGHLETYEPLAIGAQEAISRFHQDRKNGRNQMVRDFCKKIDPNLEALITFDLAMDEDRITLHHVAIKIHGYYVPGRIEDSKGHSAYHRSRFLSLDVEDYQDLQKKIEDNVYSIIQEFAKNYEKK